MEIPNGQYDVHLIKRTKKLLQTYRGNFNITLLMNSLLSLIVLPQQHNARIRRLPFMNKDLNNIAEINFILNSPNFIFDPRNFNYDLKNLLTRIRNGISHQRIEAISEYGKWKGVIIEDGINDNIGLHLELTIIEVKNLAFYIADKYLEEVEEGNIDKQPMY
jgi:hypothetical protein